MRRLLGHICLFLASLITPRHKADHRERTDIGEEL